MLSNRFLPQPNPNYPALCRQDTTCAWSTDYGGNHLRHTWYIDTSQRGGLRPRHLGVLPWPLVLPYALDGVCTDQVNSGELWNLPLEAKRRPHEGCTGEQTKKVSLFLMRDLMMTGRGLGMGLFSPGGGGRVGCHVPETKTCHQ